MPGMFCYPKNHLFFLLLFLFCITGQVAYAQALPPGQVSLQTVSSGNQLSWIDGGNNGATTLIRYNIGRSTTRGAGYVNIGNTTGLSWTDTTAVPGTTYYYVVNDQNSGGTSGWSDEVIRFYPLEASTNQARIYKNENIVKARWPIYENEVVKTFVGLSTSPGEANIVPFIDVGHATEHSFSGLTLQAGNTYYITVKIQSSEGYLNGYGTSVCSSRGFVFDHQRDLVDLASSTYFNNARARVMTTSGANSVSSLAFGNNVIRRYRAPITLTERGIESRINAPVEVNLSGTGFPGTLAAAQQQVRVADEWGNEVPCNVTANGPTDVDEYLFDAGNESVSFVDGYTSGTGTGEVTENAGNTVIRAITTNGTERTWVTDQPIDLTDWDSVIITWSNTGQNNVNNLSRCIVSTDRNGNYNANIAASMNRTRTFNTTDVIDVSGLTGNHYIRVHARRNSANSIVNVTSILLRKSVNLCTATIIANLPKGGSRNYWAFWGAGGAPLPTTGFVNSTNDTSQRAWSSFYSRKVLPPGIEDDALSSWTKLTVTVGDWYDRGGTWVSLPWAFPYFAETRANWYVGIKGILTGEAHTVGGYTQYTNTWTDFIENDANRSMISPLWQDTSVRDTDPQPQNIGFYTIQKQIGSPDARQGFYWRANRYGLLDNIYLFQTFLYQYGDIAHRYEYLSYDGLWTKEAYDNPVNVAPHHTVGISRNNGTDYFWATPLSEGIGKTPTSFFQYKNAVDSTMGATEDAAVIAGATTWGYAGHFDSHIFDSRISGPEWQSIDYQVAAGGGRVHFYVRTGSTPEPDSNWSNWALVAGNVAANGSQSLLSQAKQRFIQYRCVFIKDAAGDNPVLNRVEFKCRGFEITSVSANTPEGVTQGQENVLVTITVKNYDPGNPVSVATLTPVFSLGYYSCTLSSPAVMPHVIAAGGQADFVFEVDVAEDSPVGTATIDAVATATIGVQTFSDAGADQTHSWEVRRKAELEIQQVDATPLTVNKGQTVRVRMMISNPGGTPFLFDTASLNIAPGAYDISLDSPAASSIVEPGETITATFTVFVRLDSDSGVATLDGSAAGRNKLSNKLVSDSSSLVTDSWTVQNPANLVIETVTASDTVYRGQSAIPVFLKIINMGEALARWDSSEILLSFGSYDSREPQTSFPVDVYGGLSQVAEYWVSVAANSATGTSDVDASIKYRDGNTNDEFDRINALFPTQWTIIGEKVKTYKDSALLFQSVSFNLPTAGVVDVFARADDLAPLKEFVLRWYKPDGSEFAVTVPPKTSDASGTISHQIEIDSDPSNMGNWRVKITNPLNTHTACENVFQIVSPADPSILISLPAKVSVGQTFNASATMVNAGGAVLKTSYPGGLVKGGAGGDASFVSGPSPALLDVPGNGAATFSYLLQAVTPGTFTLRGAGYGYDGNSDAFLTAATFTSNVCTIQSPPALSVVSITEAYTNVYCNQQNLTVTMRIRNTGQADAIINAASLTFSLGTHDQIVNPPATFPFTLAGGGATADIVYTVNIAANSAAGAVAVGGSFFAHDANNPSSVFGITGGAGAWTIIAVAGICSANSTYNPEQYAFNVGQTVYARFINLPVNTEFRIRFYNDSPTGGTRVGTSPALNSGPYGVCDSSYILDPGLATTLRQRWRVSIDSGGNYTTEGTIRGFQYFDVQNPGTLQSGLTLAPASLFVGETFTATLVADNNQTAGSTIASAVPAMLQKTVGSTGNAVKLTGPTPGLASISPLLPGEYIWTFEATADTTTVGSFSLTADVPNSVAGFDSNTGAAVASNKSVSNSIFFYRRDISLGSTTIDFGSLLPGQESPILHFEVLNSGNYPLSKIKWTTADMKNQSNDYLSKANLEFTPSDFPVPVSDHVIAAGALSVPYNQASGAYIATMSVYEDLNSNSNRDSTEPVKLFSVQVQVPSARRIVISDHFIDLDNWSQGQTTVMKNVHYFNGGNLDLTNLKVELTTGSATFITAMPAAPGFLAPGTPAQLDVSAVVPVAQPNGVYIATFTIFDDADGNGLTPTDAYSEFAVKIGVGNKSFSISPLTVNAGNATPSFVIENLPFQINNTGLLGLTALKPLPGILTKGPDEIASNQIAIFLPAIVPAGAAPGSAELSIYIPMGTPAGAYSGKMWVFEDNNGNAIYDNGEASSSFNLNASVPSYSAVQVIPSTVDLGDVAAGTGISTTFLCRNIGNVTLNKLLWEKINLVSGADSIPFGAYTFPGGEPFSVPAGELFTRQISINIPAGQADGNYLGNMSWLFEDNLAINNLRDLPEPQSGFKVACRVGNLSLDLVEAGLTSTGDPSALSAAGVFSIKNDGSLTVSNPRATATALIGPETIPATASVFTPTSIGYIVPAQTKAADWRVQIPPNTAAGVYTGTITVWNDSNNDGTINPGEASDNAVLTLTVNAKRVIEITVKPLVMPMTTENSTVSAMFEIRNRGNILLNSLTGLTANITTVAGEMIPAASISFLIPAAPLAVSASTLATVTVIVGPQLPGNYRGNMRIYDDYLPPAAAFTTEESDVVELRLTIGRKTFTVSSPLTFPNSLPGATVSSNPGTLITNTAGLPLSRLKWKAGNLVAGVNSIASSSIAFLPAAPVSVPVGGNVPFSATLQILPYLPAAYVPPGTYIGTHTLWEDDNNDGVMHPTGEASGTFVSSITVLPVSALAIETDPVIFGNVVQGGNSAKVPVTVRNTGNINLTTFIWSFTSLLKGADSIDGTYLRSDPLPASLAPADSCVVDMWIEALPGAQPVGHYETALANRTSLAASGFANDTVILDCDVIPGGPPPPQIATASLYQELRTDIFTPPVPPQTDLYFLSAWICPGSGSADLALIQFDDTGAPIATLTLNLDKNGKIAVADTHPDFKIVHSGICNTVPSAIVIGTEEHTYYRVYFSFRLVFDVPDIGADSLRIILHNSCDSAGKAVWFDGIKLERAFEGQVRPTAYHPASTLSSPVIESTVQGEFYHYEL